MLARISTPKTAPTNCQLGQTKSVPSSHSNQKYILIYSPDWRTRPLAETCNKDDPRFCQCYFQEKHFLDAIRIIVVSVAIGKWNWLLTCRSSPQFHLIWGTTFREQPKFRQRVRCLADQWAFDFKCLSKMCLFLTHDCWYNPYSRKLPINGHALKWGIIVRNGNSRDTWKGKYQCFTVNDE